MIDRTKFLEPTPKYIKDFEDYPLDEVRDWYNLDLIHFAHLYESENSNPDFDKTYKIFAGEFEIKLTLEEVYIQFKDYDKNSFNELGRECVSKMRDHG